MEQTKTKYPRNYSETELAKVNVGIRNYERVFLGCKKCGQGWSPMILPGGRFRRGWWKCPNGCNSCNS